MKVFKCVTEVGSELCFNLNPFLTSFAHAYAVCVWNIHLAVVEVREEYDRSYTKSFERVFEMIG